jgi:hypothetical protein
MSIHARMMTSSRAHWVAALRVASLPCQKLPFQASAHGSNRRPACRGAAREPLARQGGNVTCPNSVNRPWYGQRYLA